MASKKTVVATLRDAGIKAGALRRAGFVPGVIYGPDYETKSLQFNKHDLDMLLRQRGLGMEVDVEIEGVGTEAVVVKEVQRDPVTTVLVHVDLYRTA